MRANRFVERERERAICLRRPIIIRRAKRLHNLLSNEFKLFFSASAAVADTVDVVTLLCCCCYSNFFFHVCACLNCVHAHSQVWCLFIVLFYLFRFGSRPVIIVYSFSNFLINNDICIDLCTVIGLSRGVLQCNSRSSGKQLITLDRIEHEFMSFSLFKMCARAIDFLSCTHKGGSFEQHWHFRTHILILQRVPCVCVCV